MVLAVLMVGGAEARIHRKPHAAPAFSAKSYLVASDNGQILTERDGETVRPIASISKLMVALLASSQDMDEILAVPSIRLVHSSIPRNVSILTRKDLLTLALVKSDNFAAQILCNNILDCESKMNEKATELGMMNTHYVEPTGLSKENVSTAHDLLKLVMAASQCPVITELSSMSSAEIPTSGSVIRIKNTNPLTSKFSIILSKTGFTNPAGGCLVMMVGTEFGRKIFILLGSRNAKTRIPDMERLVKG